MVLTSCENKAAEEFITGTDEKNSGGEAGKGDLNGSGNAEGIRAGKSGGVHEC